MKHAKTSVLVVDDHAAIRVILSEMLEPLYDVASAEDGLEAWELIVSRRFDFIVTDICMPRLNGVELARRVRERERSISPLEENGEYSKTNKHAAPGAIIIAMSSDEVLGRSMVRESLADDFISKPFRIKSVIETISNINKNIKKISTDISS